MIYVSIPGRNKTISRKSTGGHPKAAFTLRNISTSSHTNKVSNNSPSRFAFPLWDLILVGDNISLYQLDKQQAQVRMDDVFCLVEIWYRLTRAGPAPDLLSPSPFSSLYAHRVSEEQNLSAFGQDGESGGPRKWNKYPMVLLQLPSTQTLR